jgi:hypothetical protein
VLKGSDTFLVSLKFIDELESEDNRSSLWRQFGITKRALFEHLKAERRDMMQNPRRHPHKITPFFLFSHRLFDLKSSSTAGKSRKRSELCWRRWKRSAKKNSRSARSRPRSRLSCRFTPHGTPRSRSWRECRRWWTSRGTGSSRSGLQYTYMLCFLVAMSSELLSLFEKRGV